MAYRLKAHESAEEGIVRVVREQIDRTRRELIDPRLDRDKAVHQARKRFKMIRAALRLARAPLGQAYRAENARFRDAARGLAAQRDADAVIETFGRLRAALGDRMEPEAWDAVHGALVERRGKANGEAVAPTTDELLRRLDEAEGATADWVFGSDGFAALAPGLRRAYAGGRRAFAAACRDPSPDAFHEWRKRAKDLWYQARLLRPVWPETMAGLVETLDRLGELLGEDHDLAVLRDIVRHEPAHFDGVEGRLLALIDHRQSRLRAEAARLGRRVYAEKPGAFGRRLRRYWDAWQDEAEGQAEGDGQDGHGDRAQVPGSG